jgi:hypothetical protein
VTLTVLRRGTAQDEKVAVELAGPQPAFADAA